MISKINSAVCNGLEGRKVDVETDISSGLPTFNIVGLAATTVVESKDRIKASIVNSGFGYPRGRVTVNLAPAGFRKNGSQLDLPIAMSMLDCGGYIDSDKIAEYGMLGELSLTGDVVKVRGVLPMIIALRESGVKKIMVPRENYHEASLATGVEIVPVDSISDCVELVNGRGRALIPQRKLRASAENEELDFSDIKGQDNAKRAIEIAVCGRHGLLMIGSPGCGKSMLANRIPTIMPKMSEAEIMECTIIYSVMGKIDPEIGMVTERPFRTPHNSIGHAGMLGGGMHPVPGEITMAHNGVIFIDEVCEFKREVIESLRVPMEEKSISHFRQGMLYNFPCNFLPVMAANPCMCGYYGDPDKPCKCSPRQIELYQKKLSGPLRQRVDIEIKMEKVEYKSIRGNTDEGKSSKEMMEEIARARSFAESLGRKKPNGDMDDREIERYCSLSEENNRFMEKAYNNLRLSPRTLKKVLKVSRTIADLEESEDIKREHLAEALNYRRKESA